MSTRRPSRVTPRRAPWSLLGIAVVVLALFSAPARAGAIVGNYDLAIVQVSYVDATAHRYTPAQLQAAGTEIHDYFAAMSHGKLSVNVRIGTARLNAASRTRSFYWDPCAAPEGSDPRTPCPPPLLSDALTSATGRGMSMTDVDGVVVLSPWAAGDYTIGPADLTVRGTAYHVQQAYDFEGCDPYPSCPQTSTDPTAIGTPGPSKVWWNAWAHEVGHQIELQSGIRLYGNWNGHPGGYASGYDLMDSGYPLGESVYGLSTPEIGDKAVFPGWLDPIHVRTVAAPSSGSRTTSYAITPMGAPSTTSASDVRGLKLPIYRGVYLTVEARRNAGADAYGVGPGLFDEGIKIDSVQEQADPPEHPVDACDYVVPGGCVRSNADSRWSSCQVDARTLADTQPYCWPYTLWHRGNTFIDRADNVTVQVGAYDAGSNTYAVTVTRGPNTRHPDVAFTPWQTAPMHTWETQDVWVDSPCNGYGTYRYGRRDDGTAVGNGDDPCANHDNLLYARVRNLGTAPAEHVVVGFDSTTPLGVGIQGAEGWAGIGAVTEAQFPSLASIAPGAYADVSVTWNPTVDVSHLEDSSAFAFHSCVRVRATPVVGEIVTENQDGDAEQENFQYFQAPVPAGGPSAAGPSGRVSVIGKVQLTSVDPKQVTTPRTYYLEAEPDLPAGGGYRLANGAAAVTLAPGETRQLPVLMWVPAGTGPGGMYTLSVDAVTVSVEENPAIPPTYRFPGPTHTEGGVVSGAVLALHTVVHTDLTLRATTTSSRVVARGFLRPGQEGDVVMVDYVDKTGATFSHLVKVNADGSYRDTLTRPQETIVTVRAIYAGTMTAQSAWRQVTPTAG